MLIIDYYLSVPSGPNLDPSSMSETDPPSGGLVSSLFDVVSREVGSFITNATGGVVTVVRLSPA